MITKDEILNLILDIFETKDFLKIYISSPRNKSTKYFKINASTKKISDKYCIQFAMYFEDKVKHINIFDIDELRKIILEFIEIGYKQWDIFSKEKSYKALFGKKNNVKLIELKNNNITVDDISHNKEKNYILKEGQSNDWLISLGIMNSSGKILKDKYKKFKQLNKFLELLQDIKDNIPNNAKIVDIGCGKSYLTFAIYYYLNNVLKKNVSIIGLDIKKDVIEDCQKLADKLNYSNLHFINENIENFISKDKKVDMVVTLHACDTATDYALQNAIVLNADIILSVPCCQHELFKQVENKKLQPLLKYGVLKERFSALLTDSVRAILLEAFGYDVQVLEFIDMEHTPKNIMIRAIKKHNNINKIALEKYYEMALEYNINPKLFELTKDLL